MGTQRRPDLRRRPGRDRLHFGRCDAGTCGCHAGTDTRLGHCQRHGGADDRGCALGGCSSGTERASDTFRGDWRADRIDRVADR